eukprot:6190016-Pleurochrysis_carterae.AAC.3
MSSHKGQGGVHAHFGASERRACTFTSLRSTSRNQYLHKSALVEECVSRVDRQDSHDAQIDTHTLLLALSTHLASQ